MEDFYISTDKSLMNLEVIHAFLSRSYWSKNIPESIVKKSIENSFCFGVFDKKDQIGFARVITDYTTFAYLADVFILEEFRGRGLSKKLMESIMNHPDLKTIRRWMLATRDAHGLYEQFGFSGLSQPGIIMEKVFPDIYDSEKFKSIYSKRD